MSTALAPPTFNHAEPIAGYLVQERIGAGGYGEVWRAEAPGRIAKAIKVVYGHHDNQQAARELNALNRIKEVRHPFLLSIERIELVDGHLIIVTELATASLRNVFEQHVASGLAGIPRPVLLTHLSDAADALDYIAQEHSLQHLDVKPENLLIVGGRVKVADFGLVKDLQDVHSSIVGGLTPVYAAPELFDGRPNRHSDQYSLAIVYQELLTGVLPFEGRTTAQLAAQHLHGRPRLDRLPIADQAVIAKALAKDPAARFTSCREMVQGLFEATPKGPARPMAVAPTSMDHQVPLAPLSKTVTLSADIIQAGAAAAREMFGAGAGKMEPAPAVRELPPLEIGSQEGTEFRPTIFIGIGGVGASALESLQRRLMDRFGDIRTVPAVQLLLLETDPETLKRVTEGDGPALLNNDSAVLLPLRQPGDYRRESNDHLQWLSRRWIFNIPRSLQTQGFRPLGRLALVDHSDRARERIARSITAALDSEGLAVSARRTGLSFSAGPPRVFIISSISGGTGSGMALDVAYMVRSALGELGFPQEGACGILAHCAGRNGPARDLAVANACAFLAELRHYGDPRNAYPGDAAGGLPAFAANVPPFDAAYVVHVGEELEDDGFAAAADQLAEYAYRSALTPAAAFFDRCRTVEPHDGPSAGADPTVRTFGLCRLGFCRDHVPDAATDELCTSLLSRWRGAVGVDPEQAPTSLADPNALLVTQIAASRCEEELRGEVVTRAAAMGLCVGQIVNELHATTVREMGDDPESYLVTVLEELLNNEASMAGGTNRLPSAERIFDALNTLISSRALQSSPRVCLESVLDRRIEELADSHEAALGQWILGLVASPAHRVQGAQRAADYVAELLRTLSRQAGEALRGPRDEVRALEESLLAEKSGREWLRKRGLGWNRKWVADERLSRYFRLRIEELTLNGVCRLAGQVMARVAVLGDKLRNLAAELNRLAEEVRRLPTAAVTTRATSGAAELVRRVVAETIRGRKAELVAEMGSELEGELRRVVTSDESYVRRALTHILRRSARSAVLRALKNTTLDEIGGVSGAPFETIFSLHADLKTATPKFSDCGGARRLLLVAPDGVSLGRLVEQIGNEAGQPPTAITDAESDVLLCFEAEELPLRRVAATVLDDRPQIVDVASRLHARIDVAWSPI